MDLIPCWAWFVIDLIDGGDDEEGDGESDNIIEEDGELLLCWLNRKACSDTDLGTLCEFCFVCVCIDFVLIDGGEKDDDESIDEGEELLLWCLNIEAFSDVDLGILYEFCLDISYSWSLGIICFCGAFEVSILFTLK